MNSWEELKALRNKCMDCKRCGIGRVESDENPHVFSSMSFKARVMAIGQNPGWNEVLKGIPFVGTSGDNFNKEIAKYGIERSKFYICNVVRCYTPNNRSPSFQEVSCCRGFLEKEIAIINPKLIVTLGAFAFEAITGKKGLLSSHGKITESRFGIPCIPVLHPSPRNLSSPDRREMFESDIFKVSKFLEEKNG